MASRFQAVSLVASPSYPNSVAWSAENLVAVASGHIVTIMNPAIPFGPKGLITIPTSKPFPIGVIERKDLLSECLLPTCLSRDVRSCVRSISWSPIGFAPNAGCLLAICTTEGLVKVYRSPFSEFSAEWVEIMNVSEMLHTYFAKIGYGEADFRSSENSDCQFIQRDEEQGCNDDQPIKDLRTNYKYKKQRLEEENRDLPLISAEQYASRNAMLSSLIVSWSPVISNNSSNGCSILAIGAKSGRILLWRVHEPQCYSITQRSKAGVSLFMGSIEAHSSWVTAISWSKFVSNGLTQLLLSTGSSDGSVKIWRGYTDELLKSTASFSLLKEVSNVGLGPVSVLSLLVPDTCTHKIVLAIGKGSGSLEVWTYDTSIDKFDVIGPHYAHDLIVTGLAWAYGGRCLYSCSQDNSLRNWIVNGESLVEVAIPSNILGLKSSTDVPTVSDACFGVAVSPANLALAVVRSFDVNLLNPMYEARSHKAAVEFFWIGGQNFETSQQKDPIFDVEKFHDFPDTDLVNWARNILWSLNEFEDLDKPLVLWDIVGALSSLKQSKVNFIEQILVKWLTLNPENVLPHLRSCLSSLSLRKLHILNVINRLVILKKDKVNGEEKGFEEEKLALWMEILEMSEKEVRERLIGCIFSAAINLVDEYKNGYWKPLGLAQMKRWVINNERYVKDYVKRLASQVTKNEKRICEDETLEECSYCSAPISFEDTEVAFCQKHKMSRCAVTMTVCPLSPSWFCVCCRRWVSNLAPQSFFNPNATFDSKIEILSKPLCPFCGVLLQKLLPEFLLSASPV